MDIDGTLKEQLGAKPVAANHNLSFASFARRE
jgi:hypothetical protein